MSRGTSIALLQALLDFGAGRPCLPAISAAALLAVRIAEALTASFATSSTGDVSRFVDSRATGGSSPATTRAMTLSPSNASSA
jgi:hypothetical protein